MPASSLAVLRQETVARLSTVRAFKHVYDARQPQLRRDMLPAVRVYTSSTSQNLSITQPELRTTTALVVQVVCEDITDRRTAERADELAEIVRYRLMCDGTWLTLFERMLSLDCDVDRNVDGEWRSTTITLTFSLQCTEAYGPDLPAPWEELPWLDEVNLGVENGNGTGGPVPGPIWPPGSAADPGGRAGRWGVDVIDPAADPNTAPLGSPPNIGPPHGYPGGHPGPDGRIEIRAVFKTPPKEEK